MKTNKLLAVLLVCGLCFSFTACQSTPLKDATQITLSDEQILVDGIAITSNTEDAVYAANDIFFANAPGEEANEEDLVVSKDSADAHTVIHITKPGNYAINGTLSLGQIAVDLGEDAKTNPEAVVTLVLNNADITCEVAPAIIFYNAYECASVENASEIVDTKTAGANVYIVDETINTLNGAYVYNVYDGALYSTVSMNVDGGKKNSGALYVNALCEGVCSEMHLTVNGGQMFVNSGNDGINTNYDGVSVTTINDGFVDVIVNGATGEGDGIDSNGWVVLNGGTVNAAACSISADAGIDADNGIIINGGEIVATGHMYDKISGGEQNYAVFNFVESQMGGNIYELKNKKEKTVFAATCNNDFTMLLVSGKKLKESTYSFWCEDVQFFVGEGLAGGFMGDPSMAIPEDMDIPEMPKGEKPEGMPEMPKGEKPEFQVDEENTDIVFDIVKGGNIFHVFY